MIVLPIKKQWFDMIASGQKKEEYRNITPRYCSMFYNAVDENNTFVCVLRNGYSASSPSLTVRVRLSLGRGRSEWGADPNEDYFVLTILDIISE